VRLSYNFAKTKAQINAFYTREQNGFKIKKLKDFAAIINKVLNLHPMN